MISQPTLQSSGWLGAKVPMSYLHIAEIFYIHHTSWASMASTLGRPLTRLTP
jgi:hypothetical protein